jgi:predicted transcriptional regulator
MAGAGSEDRRRANRRREISDLYATILEVIKRYHGEGRVTRISYGAGMPVDRLRSSLERLGRLGLIMAVPRDGYTVYDITARGQEFLSTYWKMRGYIESLREDGGRGPR